mgnify:CR=1 FL=1
MAKPGATLDLVQLAGLATDGLLEDAEHVAEMAELNESGADGEVATQPYDQHDEEFPRKEIVERFEHEETSILIV